MDQDRLELLAFFAIHPILENMYGQVVQLESTWQYWSQVSNQWLNVPEAAINEALDEATETLVHAATGEAS